MPNCTCAHPTDSCAHEHRPSSASAHCSLLRRTCTTGQSKSLDKNYWHYTSCKRASQSWMTIGLAIREGIPWTLVLVSEFEAIE